MTLLSVRHVTTYRYRRPVGFGEHRIMFRPRDSYDQRLIDARLDISPFPQDVRWIHDVFGNCVALARFGVEADELRFESNIHLEHSPWNTPDFQMEDYAKTYPFSYGAEELPDLTRSIERQYLDPQHEIDNWARSFLSHGRTTDTGALLKTLTYAIKEGFAYERRSEIGTQDPITTLGRRKGSCRDFALLMIEAVRSLGLAARFVSGYLYVPERDAASNRDEEMPERIGGGSTHAWCQVYLPGAGWVEFDPTNGIIGNRDLIRVAVARDPRQAVPLSGTWSGYPTDSLGMSVEVLVTATPEAPQSIMQSQGANHD